MRIKDFMTQPVVTVDVRTPIMEALEIMKQNKVKRLPVMKKGRLAGLVTRDMIRDASPSEASSLSMHELNYILFKMTVGYLMVKHPITVSPEMPVEEAIWLGMQHGVGAFPVVEKDRLVGIVTESDITAVIVQALGVGESDSRRITIDAGGRRFGYIRELVDVLDAHRVPILSLMGVPKKGRKEWHLILRVKARDAAAVVEEIQQKGFKITDLT
jgi:acetoin utilization protein AcuB